MPAGPTRVRWTDHALDKAAIYRLPRSDVEHAVVARHKTRRRNAGAADWLLRFGRIAIAYDHPDHDDVRTARIVTLWRRR